MFTAWNWLSADIPPPAGPRWLTIAGDIGSILGGLALLTAGIGYFLRTRASAAEDRRLFAQRIDGLVASLAQMSPLVDSWVKDGSIPATTIRQAFDGSVGSLMGLESEARGPKMRRVAEEIEGILSAFAIHVSAFGPDLTSRAALHRDFKDVAHYLLLARHILLTTADDPVRALSGIGIRRAPDMEAVLRDSYDMPAWPNGESESSETGDEPGLPDESGSLPRP